MSIIPCGFGIFPNTYWVFQWFYLLLGGLSYQITWLFVQRTFIRLLKDCLFWVKTFMLRRLKKPPDPVLFDMPEMIELVTIFQTTMGPFNLAKKVLNFLSNSLAMWLLTSA